MHMKLPVVLLSLVALAVPGVSYAKDKNKDKNRGQASDDRRDDRDDDRDRDRGDDRGGKITICHVPPGNRSNRHTITVGESAWAAHEAHGDRRGACRTGGGPGGGGQGGRFEALDRNNDNVISANEWLADRGSFLRLDRNKDGVISRDEFSRY
jgi:hypothetical protein